MVYAASPPAPTERHGLLSSSAMTPPAPPHPAGDDAVHVPAPSCLARLDPLARFNGRVKSIMAMEAAERFSYYGTRSVLALYLTDALGFSYGNAVGSVSFFLAASYLSPFLGGWVADAVLGKFRTILAFDAVYIVGSSVLALTAVAATATSFGVPGTVIGLMLLAAGAGGIKPCCGPCGVDQLGSASAETRSSFWLLWYFMINFGTFGAYLFVPMARGAGGFGAAFGLCTLLLVSSLALFLAPRRSYVHVPPARVGVYALVARVLWFAAGGRREGSAAEAPAGAASSGSALGDDEAVAALSAPDGLLVAKEALPPFAQPAPPRARFRCSCFALDLELARGHVSDADLAGVRAFLGLVPVFACLPLFWAVNDATDSIWVLQRKAMDLCVVPAVQAGGACAFALQPDQFGVLNPLLILLLVPLFERGVLPALTSFAARPGRALFRPTPLRRMAVGMQLAASAFAVTALVQSLIDAGQRPSVAWHVLMYVIMGFAEMLVSATGLEFAAGEAPAAMQGSVLALFYCSVFLGDAGAGSLFAGLSAVLSPLQLIVLVCALTSFSGLLFAVVAARFRSVRADTAADAEAGVDSPAVAAAAAAP